MGVQRVTTDLTPVENLEYNIIASAAKTTAQSIDFTNSAGKDLYVIVDVTTVVAAVAEVASLAVTAAATTTGNVTVTLNGTGFPVAVDSTIETTATLVATKIRGTSFTGWTTGGSGTTVTFTSTTTGTRTDATYSAGTTGATGTMTTTTQGTAAASITPTICGLSFTGKKEYILGSGSAITATGTYVYLVSKNANTAHDGITAVFDAPVPKSCRFKMAVANTTSVTYSVDVAICQ
jgi:hypothetical protein